MRVIVEEAVFATRRTDQLGLQRLFGHGFDGRHLLQTDPLESEAVKEWLDRQDAQLREECKLALELGLTEDARFPAALTVRIAEVDQPDWDSDEPRLDPETALRLLDKPLAIVVEDDVRDRNFLLATATGERKRALHERVRKGWVDFRHGGGLESMQQRVETWKQPLESLRTWLLFDSDALRPDCPSDPSAKLARLCGNELPFQRIFYDLESEDFLIQGRKEFKKTWLPSHILLDSRALLRFQRNLPEIRNLDELIDRADRIANAFRNYKIPVIPIVAENLEHVTKAFQRINSSGTQMSDVHMVAALTYSPQFDLLKRLKEIRRKLTEESWGPLEEKDEKLILSTVRVANDLDIVSPDAERISGIVKKNPSLIDQVAEYLILAARFFREYCGIPSPQLVPYGYQIVLLAEAMRINPNPSDEIVANLRQWLWHTAYTGYFAGARDTDVRKALEEVRGLIKGSPLMVQEEKVGALPKRFDFRAARAKLVVLRLAEQQPQSPDERPLDTCTVLNAYGNRAIMQLVSGSDVSGGAASGPENRFIVHPDDARAFRKKLLSGCVGEPFLKSHAVSPQAAKALERKEYQAFLALRRETLVDLERAFVEPLGLRFALE